MKKIITSSPFSLTFMLLFTSALADIIPLDVHPLNSCVKFVNVHEFPDIVLIARDKHPSGQFGTYQIKNNTCIGRGYKFNIVSIYWNTKDKPNCLESNNLVLSGIELPTEYVHKNDPLVEVDIEYSLARSFDGTLILYKSKQISEYNDGRPNKVETFAKPSKEKEIKKQKNQVSKDTQTLTPAPSPHGCVKIVNLNKFPDIVLIGHYNAWIESDGTTTKEFETYPIENNTCIKGEPRHFLNVYWNTKDKPNCIESEKHVLIKPGDEESIHLSEWYIKENDRLAKIDIEYSLVRSSDGKLILYKSKQISEYNDGTTKMETFTNPLEKRFWRTISCFFKRLFGYDC